MAPLHKIMSRHIYSTGKLIVSLRLRQLYRPQLSWIASQFLCIADWSFVFISSREPSEQKQKKTWSALLFFFLAVRAILLMKS
jgi:hypothetical protein